MIFTEFLKPNYQKFKIFLVVSFVVWLPLCCFMVLRSNTIVNYLSSSPLISAAPGAPSFFELLFIFLLAVSFLWLFMVLALPTRVFLFFGQGELVFSSCDRICWPNVYGWIFIAFFWIILSYLLSCLIASLEKKY